jgi:hypothetical protein
LREIIRQGTSEARTAVTMAKAKITRISTIPKLKREKAT